MKYSLLLFCLWSSLGLASTMATVDAPAAFMYKVASSNSPVTSQVIYGSSVKILHSGDSWSKVRSADDYVGWMRNTDLSDGLLSKTKHLAEVNNLFANIYRETDETKHQPIITVPFATKLPIIKIVDERWLQVELVGGAYGYVLRGDVKIDPKPLSLQQMLRMSHKFIGVPYTWGGVSSYGIDCSGFVQMLFNQMGIELPRDTGMQASWHGFKKVGKDNLQPGDVLFFGWNNKISHVGVYLGNSRFIDATAYKNPIVQINNLSADHWQKLYVTARRLKQAVVGDRFVATIHALSSKVKSKMKEYTWRKGCPVALNDLVMVKMTYFGFDNRSHSGRLIVNKYLAPEVRDIFHDLYVHKFPIQSMRPMYMYKGDDDASMVHNNTSAFNCRKMTDFPNQYSIHSYGGAIDINPLINPYVYGNNIQPIQGKRYLDRSVYHKGKTTNNSFIVKDFIRHGWIWGGSWSNMKDYQHFEKPLNK